MYKIEVCNPYFTFNDGDVICVTTNGEIKKDGRAVMGAGNAKFARDNFPNVDLILAEFLTKYGNHVFILGKYQFNGKNVVLVSFPTKNSWRDKSDLNLIEQSSRELLGLANHFKLEKIYLPAPGCSNGQLKWSDVKNKLSNLDDRFIVYSLDKETFDF